MKSIRLSLVVLSLCFACLCPVSAGERLPVPDKEKQKEAIALVREAFGKDLKSKDDAVRKELAQTLLKQADDPGNDDTTRFVLLMMAATVAAEAGEADTAMQAVERVDARYKAKTAGIMMKVLDTSYKKARKPEEYTPVAQGYINLVQKAIRSDEFDVAGDAARQAKFAARKAKDKALYEQTKDLDDLVRDAEKQYKAVSGGFETLKQNPDDPEANLAAGRYICFVKDDWAEGLPHLAKGSDTQLAEAAAADMKINAPKEEPASDDKADRPRVGGGFLSGARTTTPSVDAKALVPIADTYYEVGEKEKKGSPERSALMQRAKTYYEQALPALSGLAKVKVEKRVEGIVVSSGQYRDNGILYVQADESAEIYINRKKVLSIPEHTKVYKAETTLGLGDVIAVEYINHKGAGGVTLAFDSPSFTLASKAGLWKILPEDANLKSIRTSTLDTITKRPRSSSKNADDRKQIHAAAGVMAETLEAEPFKGTLKIATVVSMDGITDK